MTSNFRKIFTESDFVITEGGMVERIRRNSNLELDPQIVHAGLIYHTEGKKVLEKIYKSYLDIALANNFPVLTYAPTWRANPYRILKSSYKEKDSINKDGVDFLDQIRNSYGNFSSKIFVGGLMACKGDAYKAEEALSTDEAYEFHKKQANELAKSEADFIKAATLPAYSEALGIAQVLSELNVDYIISFVVKPEGVLLDGTPIHKAIEGIDEAVQTPPFFYMLNCVHPSAFKSSYKNEIEKSDKIKSRLLGFQANTSAKTPEELDQLDYLDTTEPKPYADQMIDLYKTTGLKMLGGCCGSDDTHINEIAIQIKNLKP